MEDNNKDTVLITRPKIEFEKMEEVILTMINDQNLLKRGYIIFSDIENHRNFYINFLKIIFGNYDAKCRKLCCSSLKIFLNKNWSDDNYITNDERLV